MNNLHRELAPISEAAWSQIQQEATAYFQRIEKLGGMIRALESGFFRREIADCLLAGVIDDDPMAGLDQPPRHVRAHIAETDEADVHGLNSDYVALIVDRMNSARTLSVCRPKAGTVP